jgi:hypothetical protein
MNKLALLITCILIQPSQGVLAQDVDLTGTWTSEYQFGPIQEVMTANIQQLGANLIGSFTVKPSEGESYSGIIFGTVEGNKATVNYLSVRNSGDIDPQVVITLADSRIIDQNKLKGTYYVQDSKMNAISGPFEATRN